MHAVSEVDGVRIVAPDVCDFIQKVPASTVSIFRPGSTSPSAILYDAWENFSHRSPKADENIRSIKPDLAAAVDDCIDAAGREWEPYWQRRLLNVSDRVPLHLSGMYLSQTVNSIRPLNLGELSSTCITRQTLLTWVKR